MGGGGISSSGGFVAKQYPPELLQRDFTKHREEFSKNLTEEGYERKAINLINTKPGGNVLGFTSEKGRVYRYRKKENEFAICESDGSIATFFKPTDGIDYWWRQVDAYKP